MRIQLHDGSVARGFSCIGVQLHGVPLAWGSVARWFSCTIVPLHGGSVRRGSVTRGLSCMRVQLQEGSVKGWLSYGGSVAWDLATRLFGYTHTVYLTISKLIISKCRLRT